MSKTKHLIFADLQVKPSNLEVAVNVMDQIINFTKDNGIKTVFFLGDLFETKRYIDITCFNEIFKKLHELSSQIDDLYMLVGNHDLALRNSITSKEVETSIDSLFPFAKIIKKKENILVNGINYVCIPFQKDIYVMRGEFIESSEEIKDNGRFNVLLFHTEYNEFSYGHGASCSSPLKKKDIRFDRYDYSFGGHIHNRTIINKKSLFIGAPFEHTRDEKNSAKGFMTLDVKEKKFKFHETNYPKFMEIKNKKEWKEKRDSIEGNYVDVYLTDENIIQEIRSKAKSITIIRPELKYKEDSDCNILTIRDSLISYLKGLGEEGEKRLKDIDSYLTSNLAINTDFRLATASVENFLSYRRGEFKIPLEASNNHMTAIMGVNKDTGGSNGSGKSSIIEFIHYGLYGETVRGSQVGSVVNRKFKKNCKVVLEFQSNGEKHYIERYRNHKENGNSICYNGLFGDKNILQKDINSIVASPEVFRAVAILDKSNRSFLEVKPAERKNLLEGILGLSWMDKVLDGIKKEEKEHNNVYKELKYENEGIDKSIITLRNQIEEARKNYQDINQRESKNSERNRKRMKELRIRFKSIEEQKNIITEKLVSSSELFDKINEKMKELTLKKFNIYKKKNSEILILSGEEAIEKSKIDRYNLYIKKALEQDSKNINCPYCFSVYDKKKFVDKANSEISECNDKREKVLSKIKNIEQKFDNKEQKCKNKLEACDEKQKSLKERIEKYRNKVKKYTLEMSEIKEELAIIQTKEEAGIDLLNESRKNQENLLKSKRELEKIYKENEQKIIEKLAIIEEKDFWLGVFGKDGFRQSLYDSIIPVLESNVNHFLARFNMKCGIRKTGKNNDIDIFLISGEEKVSYEEFSGGEKNRIDLAVILSLNSIASDLSFKSNVIFMDELFTNIDEIGAQEVYDICKEYCQKKNIRLYSISHLTEVNDLFENVITVEKENGISKILGGKSIERD